MSVDSDGTERTDYTTDGADGPGWDPGLDDEGTAVLKAIGRQLKMWREAAGLRQAEFGAAIGYSDEMVSSVERGRRAPKPQYLEKADEVLGARGKIEGMKKDVAEARYPKKVRDLARLEDDAVELGAYSNTTIHGLLQTEEYTRVLFGRRQPTYGEDEIERLVAARMARQEVFERRPAPLLTFVQEEALLRRPIGGRMVLRRQLERLLELGKLRNVEIQVMPTETEEHAGLGGSFRVLKLSDGTTVGHNEVQLTSRLIANPKEVHVLEMRYGMIRAQALRSRESLAFIEKLRGET
ncbi:helix-turn-helix domain-containing protein [Streptomyces celluloflavus]|uniref:helix-turn-helix domain-containing protein n=1 Tax=Streptomyces TaxID=1883 RepID=UPI000AF6EB36|nr:helix-turn-helix transcriptional regulator [Streptomyces sp. SID7805]MYU50785.1 helix-turn-helix domain-containing protein [Streptomyces sp. SID7805]WSK13548.1 helix-turn-helix transcriptional regulator [Streptomyces celluloflavus]